MTDHIKPANAWAWVGIVLSLALNVFACWIVVQVLERPDPALLPPPSCQAGKS